jgi:hypothetical protein
MEPMGIEQHRWASREAEVSGRERVNTDSSGSGGIDDIKSHPQGEIRGATKPVKSRLFSAVPEGTVAQIFATLGYAVLYSTLVHRPTPSFTRENCGGESRPCAATSKAQRAGLLLPARAFFASSITRCSISRGISS